VVQEEGENLVGRNPGTTRPTDNQIYGVPANQFSPSPGTTLTGEWPQNQILIPDWTYFHCLVKKARPRPTLFSFAPLDSDYGECDVSWESFLIWRTEASTISTKCGPVHVGGGLRGRCPPSSHWGRGSQQARCIDCRSSSLLCPPSSHWGRGSQQARCIDCRSSSPLGRASVHNMSLAKSPQKALASSLLCSHLTCQLLGRNKWPSGWKRTGTGFRTSTSLCMSKLGPDPSKYQVRHAIPLGKQPRPAYFPEARLPSHSCISLSPHEST